MGTVVSIEHLVTNDIYQMPDIYQTLLKYAKLTEFAI